MKSALAIRYVDIFLPLVSDMLPLAYKGDI